MANTSEPLVDLVSAMLKPKEIRVVSATTTATGIEATLIHKGVTYSMVLEPRQQEEPEEVDILEVELFNALDRLLQYNSPEALNNKVKRFLKRRNESVKVK